MNRSFFDLFRLLILVLVSVTFGCSGNGTGGEQTVIFPDESKSEDPGPNTYVIEGPAESAALQSALDNVKPGDTIVIKAGSGVYHSDDRYPGETIRGFTLANSGTSEEPIRIVGEGVPGHPRPIIDQGKSAVHDPAASGDSAEPTVGLYLLCASHIEIENLEIRNVHLAGITTSLRDCATENLSIRNTHIHHIYGERNVAAIRLSRVSQVVVEHNQLHDVFRVAGDEPEALVSGTNTGVSDVAIRHNDFSDLPVGVQLRGQNDKHLEGLVISLNRFERVEAALAARLDGADENTLSSSAVSNVNFHDNLIVDSEHGIIARLDNTTQQSGDLHVFNNTVHGLNNAFMKISGIEDVDVYNNILSNVARDLLVAYPVQNSQLHTQFAEYDFNLYWSTGYTAATGPQWLLDLGSDQPLLFDSLQAWQVAYTATLHDSLSSDPDSVSQFTDPQFVNPSTGDYRAQAPFAQAGGRHGEPIGAYRNGETPGL